MYLFIGKYDLFLRGVVRDFTAVWRHTHLYTHTHTHALKRGRKGRRERERGTDGRTEGRRERVSACVLLQAWTGHD